MRDRKPVALELDLNSGFDAAIHQIVQIARAKGADYAKDGNQWSSFIQTAELMGMTPWEVANMFEITKLTRISALKSNGREPENETVYDSYLDKAAYAVHALAMLIDFRMTPPEKGGDIDEGRAVAWGE